VEDKAVLVLPHHAINMQPAVHLHLRRLLNSTMDRNEMSGSNSSRPASEFKKRYPLDKKLIFAKLSWKLWRRHYTETKPLFSSVPARRL